MAGYDKGGALILLDDYGLFPSEGVFMKSGGDHLLTKFEKSYAANGDAIYTLANTRLSSNVLVKFEGTKVLPVFFKWRNKTYEVEKLNLVHKEQDGNDKIYYFSISDNANFFRLAFFTRDLSWKIQELFYE